VAYERRHTLTMYRWIESDRIEYNLVFPESPSSTATVNHHSWLTCSPSALCTRCQWRHLLLLSMVNVADSML